MPILLFTALALLLASCPSGTEGLPEEEESPSSSGGNGPVTQTPTPGAPVIPAPALKDIRVTYGEKVIKAVFTFDIGGNPHQAP
jgi:hypothetical protein